MEILTGAEIDTLVGLVEEGPLCDGDVPSKLGRDNLIEKGLAVRIIVQGEDGFTASTYKGRDAYRKHFSPMPDGSECGTISEAMLMRKSGNDYHLYNAMYAEFVGEVSCGSIAARVFSRIDWLKKDMISTDPNSAKDHMRALSFLHEVLDQIKNDNEFSDLEQLRLWSETKLSTPT